MAKLTLNDLGNGFLANQVSAASTINGNNAKVEAALENTLSRDGSGPNTMNAPLDMNSNRIINLPKPVSPSDPLRKQDLADFSVLELQEEIADTISAQIGALAVKSVAGKIGDVVLDKTDVGLGNVSNTSDLSKPVSTAVQAALNQKAPINSPTFTGTVSGITKAMVGLGNVDNTSDLSKPISNAVQAALNLKADAGSSGGPGASFTNYFRTLDEFKQNSDPDDTLAFQRWANQASTNNTVVNVLFLPFRDLSVSNTIELQNKNAHIVGAGRTRINITTTLHFLIQRDLTGQDNSYFSIEGIEFQALQAGTNAPVNVIKPYSASSHNKQFFAKRLTFVGGLGYFLNSIYVYNVWNGVVEDAGGNNYYSSSPQGVFLNLDGMSNAWEVKGSTAYGFATHIKVGMYDGGSGMRYPTEGLKVFGGEAVGCNTGIDYQIPDSRSRPAVGLLVVNYHTNIHSVGVYCRNVYQITISNHLGYTIDPSANDFYFVNCSIINVVNSIFGGQQGTRAITMIACSILAIGICSILSRNEGIYADGASSNGRIHTPVSAGISGGPVSLPAGNGGNGIFIVA